MTDTRKRVAAVITEWRKHSHADVLLSRILEPERWGHRHPFGLKLAAVYADQFPKDADLCRDLCRRFGVPVFPTIKGAIGVGGDKVAVDGVLLIGEHGNYPRNGRGQQLYPRRRLFEGIVDALRILGRRVPVFSDKHLSYDWFSARWMYDVARHEGIPLMAGSSLPVGWRNPELEIPLGTEMAAAVSTGYADLDAYGFHAIETLQCMVERRKGGETGVSKVQAMPQAELARELAKDDEIRHLFDAVYRIRHGSSFRLAEKSLQPGSVLWKIHYKDGLVASVGMFQGFGEIFGYANKHGVPSKSEACLFELEYDFPFGHFGYLLKAAERMIETGKPSYPVERTLLTTGLLSALIQSQSEGGSVIATPHLAEIHYQPVSWPHASGPIGNPA